MRKLVLVTALCLFACGGSNGNTSDGGSPGGPGCGDGKKQAGEACDDGNTVSGDGCSADCKIEPGFICVNPNAPCFKMTFCGDGILQSPEVCDDGNPKAGDGCDGTCHPEPGFNCTTPGQPCESTAVCGDGVRTGSEKCDDGNTIKGDGCDACAVEDGWTCPSQGGKCAPTCGDGKVIPGKEQCDLGANNAMNKGCSAACTVDAGWVCPNNVCHQTVCGDKVKEGSEQCDDGNLVPFDGCSPTCTVEPKCSGGNCTATCGDGLVFAPEQCDDGNVQDGDGCDHTCNLEPNSGFDCTPNNQPPPATLAIPILYHDLLHNNNNNIPNASPDFENFNPGVVLFGLVKDKLGMDGKPDWADDFGFLDQNKTQNNTPVPVGKGQALNGKDNFDCWYRDACKGASDNKFATNVWLDAASKPTTLTLNQQTPGANIYEMDNPFFFPIDGLGWNAPGSGFAPQTDKDLDGADHNFSFTSELHYPFTYKADPNPNLGPKFDFTGDDDVWVFINGQLAVDLGGVHGAEQQSIVLNQANAATLDLIDGGMYSIDMFQAERHTAQSTYHLTLSGFVHESTTCTPHCGDGKVVGNEVCDDGPNNGMPGFCNATCSGRVAKCGDSIITPPEQCDNGTNDDTYGTCTKQCKLAAFCGDGQKNGPEQCDNGAQNVGFDQYGPGLCTVACTIAPYCGDGIVEPAFGEQCDGGTGCFDCHYAVIQ